ncbi:MAG TPA: hypothetical protein PKY55_02320 [bacterium]|nr:hypothetical protein [bacterium]
MNRDSLTIGLAFQHKIHRYGILLVILLCIVLRGLHSSHDYSNPVDQKNKPEEQLPTEGLVAWYPFNGNANDESGHGRNGTVYGALLTADRMGRTANAYQFDGVDDYIDLGDWPFGGEMTISAWVNYQAFNRWSRVVDLGNGENVQNIVLSNTGNSSTIAYHIYYTGPSAYLESANLAVLNEWIFLTASVTSNGNMYLYKNGELAASGTGGFPPNNLTRVSQFIARSNWSVDGYFKGRIDDVRIYNRVLSDAEIETLYHENGFYHPLKTPEIKAWGISDSSIKIQWSTVPEVKTYVIEHASSRIGPFSQLYSGADTSFIHSGLTKNQTVWYRVQACNDHTSSAWSDIVLAYAASLPVTGMVAYYPFNGSANDESKNGNDGVVYGAALTEDRFGNTDKAYSFNGRDSYIIVNSSPSLQPTKEITVAVWLLPLSYPTDATDGWMGILTKRINENIAPWDSYVISIHKEHYLQFAVYDSPDALKLQNVELGKWIFALGTMSDNEIKLYINGLLHSRLSRGGDILYSSLSLRIGTLSINRLNPFNGKIDDIRIYNHALSDQEISSLYHEDGWGYGQ